MARDASEVHCNRSQITDTAVVLSPAMEACPAQTLRPDVLWPTYSLLAFHSHCYIISVAAYLTFSTSRFLTPKLDFVVYYSGTSAWFAS
jgi:hypothetical protein